MEDLIMKKTLIVLAMVLSIIFGIVNIVYGGIVIDTQIILGLRGIIGGILAIILGVAFKYIAITIE